MQLNIFRDKIKTIFLDKIQQGESLSEKPKFLAPKLIQLLHLPRLCGGILKRQNLAIVVNGKMSSRNHLQILLKTKKAEQGVQPSTVGVFEAH